MTPEHPLVRLWHLRVVERREFDGSWVEALEVEGAGVGV